ncbi:lipoprotein insertase outer membrane protein LolB [Polaromonas sp.]|uniref:lipoprotein insertase outer membrane protein LolB n=1 Tax=Polaromonas sp. TaxID=1869339 RepID=UPI002FC8CAF4
MLTACHLRALLVFGLAFAIFLIAGCAHPTRATDINSIKSELWTGRLSLQVHSEPMQFFSAGFELKGNAGAGELTLSSPLGNTLAVLHWSAGEAVLNSGHQVQRFASVNELMEKATGTAVPVAALFDWLGGRNTALDGWTADLSQQATGRISARRTEPQPQADLRVVLDQ